MYDPETGKFWREAGCQAETGYRYIWFQDRQHLEHRVAWYLHYGQWPKQPVDHINGNRADNRISNLRLASPSENGRNRCRPKNNTSGFKGVSWNPKRKLWQATIKYEGSNKNLGSFATREKASLAYNRAALLFHGKFANLDL
jgi:hypothetical protein